ncbi:hypothetical protein ACTAZI_15605 [Legionella bozemanae]|uniref:hypothetical protein n=1 Tax=Legionella bozemanae TaxID=447 RepID=UPI003EEA9367
MEWNGKDRKGENINKSKVEPLPVDIDESNTDASTQLFAYWQSTMIHPRAKFDRKRKQAITKALKLEYSIAELKQAIDGCKNTPYNMGKNDTGQVYDDISLILRDAAHIERFICNADNYPSEQCSSTATDLMAGVL